MNKGLIEFDQSELLRKMNELVQTAESTNLFPYAFEKSQLHADKKKFFAENLVRKVIVVTNPTNYENVSSVIQDLKITKMPEQELAALCEDVNLGEKQLNSCIVIFTNNNLAKITPNKLSALVSACTQTLFIIHDFDNHHWHEMSIKCALLSDVYAPAHLADLSIIGRITPTIQLGVPCGTIQWTKQFLLERIDQLLTIQRHQAPLGKHSFYSKFNYRNTVLATINKHYPSVGFIEKEFHGRSADERWLEWANYPLHWIAPVFNDLPLRFFDSLVTGGIPLIPMTLKPYVDFLKIPPEYYLCYGPKDIIDVENFITAGLKVFNKLGKEGQLARFNFALQYFHVDAIIAKLFTSCFSQFECRGYEPSIKIQ